MKQMKVFLTGGTGFIGGRVAAQLRGRGDEVIALVRSPAKAGPLKELGCELIHGDLDSVAVMQAVMQDCDAAIHSAAMYQVGVPDSARAAMFRANVTGTENVLDAAAAAGVPRIVYVSSVGVFGNTGGHVVTSTYARPPGPWLSLYDETKYLAHHLAKARAERAPVVIAMPGGVYGPGDVSDLSRLIAMIRSGRLRMKLFPETGFNFGHVDDIAAGIVLVLDKGRLGESYVLGGDLTTAGHAMDLVTDALGKERMRHALPGWAVRAALPLWPLLHRLLDMPPNLREMIRVAEGVTYWATDAKARSELGYNSRPLALGLRETLAADVD